MESGDESVWDRSPDPDEVLARSTRPPPDSTADDPGENSAEPEPSANEAPPVEPDRERPPETITGQRRSQLIGIALIVAFPLLMIWGFRVFGSAAEPDDTAPTPTLLDLSAMTAERIQVVVTTPPIVTSPPTFASTSTTTPPTSDPAPVTTASPTTAVTTTAVTTTTAAAAPTTVAPAEPRVEITARRGSCNYGSDCLIAGFSIDGFATPPREFVCEFADGSRFAFRFETTSVDSACSSGSAGATITIEVDGVRSTTIDRTTN